MPPLPRSPSGSTLRCSGSCARPPDSDTAGSSRAIGPGHRCDVGHRQGGGASLTELSELDGLAEDVGAVDILVNNAGFAWYGPTSDLAAATFDHLFATNVRAPYFLVAALAPAMASRGSGSIINIGSRAGQ